MIAIDTMQDDLVRFRHQVDRLRDQLHAITYASTPEHAALLAYARDAGRDPLFSTDYAAERYGADAPTCADAYDFNAAYRRSTR